MRVLVTGAEGYIGSRLVPVLLARGYQVVGLDAGFYAEGALYDGLPQAPERLHKDVRQVTVEDLQGFEAVVHLAELSNDPLGELNPALTYAINHRGSVALAQKCKHAGVQRFVYASSCSVYGVGTEAFKTEASLPQPQTAYAECKVLVERDVSALADDAFSPTFLRNATVYGPSPRMRFDLVLNNLAGLAWTTGEIRMTSDGTPWRPLVHVLDVCTAIACVLEAPRELVHNQVFNVGSTQENYRIREIAALVAQAFPGCKLRTGPPGADNRSYRVSFEKIHATLPGFACQYTAAAGAKELHDLFARIRLTPELFAHRHFTRLKQLQHLLRSGQLDAELFWTSEGGKA